MMIKRLILIALVAGIGLSATACGKKGDVHPPKTNEQQDS